MAGLGVGVVNVLANTANFENSLRRSFKRISIASAAVVAGVASADFFGGAISQAMDLEKEVGKIQTLLDTPADKGLFSTKQIRDFSNAVGIGTKDITDSVYYALGTGIPAANVFDVVKASAKEAIATGGDLATVVQSNVANLNAYAKTNLTASHASDVLTASLFAGGATINDLSKYISTATPIASSLGISLEQVAAAGAAGTLNGTTARRVFTGLKVAMQELNNSSKGAGKVFKKVVGEDFQTYIKRTGDLKGAFDLLTKGVGGAKNLTNVFGAKEGATQIANLENNAVKYQAVLDQIKNSAGTVNKAYDIVDATTARQVQHLKTYFSNFRTSVGESLLPVVSKIVHAIVQYGPQVKAFFMDNIATPIAQLKPYWDTLVGDVQSAVSAIGAINWSGIFSALQTAIQGALVVIAPLFAAFDYFATTVLPSMVGPLNAIIGFLDRFAPVLGGIVAGYVAWKLVAEAAVAIELIKNAYLAIGTGLTTAYIIVVDFWTAAMGTATLAGGGFAGVLAVIDALLEANPIGIVVTALVALGVAFYLAWTKSETFRDIVRDTWNVIVTAVGIAVKIFVDLMAMYAEAPLRAFDLVLKGLSHLPSWLGGGVAAGAEGAVSALIGQIESWRNAAINAIDDVVQAAKLIPPQFDSTGLANADFGYGDNAAAKITADLAAQGITQASMDALKKHKSTAPTGGGGGGTYDPTADKNAASAAKSAAAAHKAAMKTLSKDMDKFANVTGKTTVNKIQTMIDKIKADYKALGEKVPASIKKVEDALLKSAKAQATNTDKLNAAKSALKTLTDEAKTYVDTLKASTTLDITGLGSVDEIKFRMGQMLSATTTFIANIKKLKSEGLSGTLLKQLVDAGPLSGGAAAAALASASLGDLASINQTQTQLEGLGDQLGQVGYDSFKAAGISMAQGIVVGFQSQAAILDKTITDLGDKLPKTFAKSIKAHSPSRVFMDQAGHIVDGLVVGLDSHGYKAVSAMSGLSDSMNMGMGGVGAGGSAIAPAAGGVNGGTPEVHVYIGDRELTDIVRVEVGSNNRAIKSRASTRSRSGVVTGGHK